MMTGGDPATAKNPLLIDVGYPAHIIGRPGSPFREAQAARSRSKPNPTRYRNERARKRKPRKDLPTVAYPEGLSTVDRAAEPLEHGSLWLEEWKARPSQASAEFTPGARGYTLLERACDAQAAVPVAGNQLQPDRIASAEARRRTVRDKWLASLSPREAQVMRLSRRGLNPAEIARDMGVSRRTVRTLWQRAAAKLRRVCGDKGHKKGKKSRGAYTPKGQGLTSAEAAFPLPTAAPEGHFCAFEPPISEGETNSADPMREEL